MNTYYIRHTKKLDVDEATRRRLWSDRRIAIHFPYGKDGKLHKRDNRSLDPDDYPSRDGKAVRALRGLAKDGGYVCAEFVHHSECILGYVKPSSRIDLVRGTWGSRNKHDGREAILKSLRLEKVKLIMPCLSAVILVGRPRQGTMMRWKRAGKTVENIVKGKRGIASLADLSTEQQETMCSEFLRSEGARKVGLPKLAHLLLPVGRTMRDIDIYGITESGTLVIGQVSYSSFDECVTKLEKLLPYGEGRRNALVLFCNCSEPTNKDGVRVISLRDVYDAFVATPSGKLWIQQAIPKVG
jgi:hypothetical protein